VASAHTAIPSGPSPRDPISLTSHVSRRKLGEAWKGSEEDHNGRRHPSDIRVFLFAEVRDFTRFSQERGDVEATRLVERFARLARSAVNARGGEVIELRGDEALAVFASARQALRAAVELQADYGEETERDPSLPLRVGIGLDAGEAIPFEGGYRGRALNLAARLKDQARAGQVLATEALTDGTRSSVASCSPASTWAVTSLPDTSLPEREGPSR
jgi:class 3 adenylate cyclase